jgi:cytochrome c biogenesis protein
MKKIFGAIASFLASINLTIILLSVATLIFILQIAQEKLVLAFPSWKWLAAIGQFDFYHSRGFFVLFALFCANLVACTFKRLPRTIAILKSSPRIPDDAFIASMNGSPEVEVDGSQLSREKLQAVISAHFSRLHVIKDDGGRLCFYAEKGRYTHLGFYLAHVCILLIAIGTILSTLGFQYSFDVTKGQLLDPLVVRDATRQEKALDFSLQCNDLKTVSYGESSKLKKHQSTLTILKNGVAVKTLDVDFGTHLTYNGVDIYQDRFSKTINYAKIEVRDMNGKQQEYELKVGESFSAGNAGEKLRLTRISKDSVQLRSLSSTASLWITRTPAQFKESQLQGYQFSLIELLQKETTSLKAIYDPGQGLIWYSFIAMIAGFSICFFLSHQRLWVKVDMQEGRTRVVLAGAATKNQNAFIDILSNIKDELERGLKP